MQPFKFNSIEEFFNYIPESERRVVMFLRDIIMGCMPDCKEKLAYNVPYYYRNSRICFIWSPSVPWGAVSVLGVQLGFCNGHLLNDPTNYLEKGNRKQVYIKTFNDITEIEVEGIKLLIYNAVDVDDGLKKKK